MPDNLVYVGSRHRIRRWRNYGITSGPPAVPVVFLFRDDFLTDEGAPLTSPRTAEPGPGIALITDAGVLISISGGDLFINGNTAWGNAMYFTNSSFARTAGLMLLYKQFLSAQANQALEMGFDVDQASRVSEATNEYIRLSSAQLHPLFINNTGLFTVANRYDHTIILRETGAFYLIRGNTEYSEWTIHWISDSRNDTPYFVGLDRFRAGIASQIDQISLNQLPSPWDTDYGIATDRLAGARAPGDTFVHEADCLIEWEETALPGVGASRMIFREQDPNNHWFVFVVSNGDFQLYE